MDSFQISNREKLQIFNSGVAPKLIGSGLAAIGDWPIALLIRKSITRRFTSGHQTSKICL